MRKLNNRFRQREHERRVRNLGFSCLHVWVFDGKFKECLVCGLRVRR